MVDILRNRVMAAQEDNDLRWLEELSSRRPMSLTLSSAKRELVPGLLKSYPTRGVVYDAEVDQVA